MPADIPNRYNSAFDSRMQFNDNIGACLQDIRLNRLANNYDAWRRSINQLLDIGRTFVPNARVQETMLSLDKAHRMIMRYESLDRHNDVKSIGAKRKIGYEIEKILSDAQVETLRAMAEKGMVSPLKVPLEEWSDQEIADGMGL